MRIIGGKLKGKVILPPAGYKARPTTDFAKEGLFNILDNEYEFEDLKVLDLFGGTGSIAFEFASRGAARVYSVEMARENASFIKTEAARLGLSNVTMVRDMPWKVWKPSRTRYSLMTCFIQAVTSSWSMEMSIPSLTTLISKKNAITAVSILAFLNKL